MEPPDKGRGTAEDDDLDVGHLPKGRDTFAVVAHAINNPLAALVTNLQLVAEALEDDPDALVAHQEDIRKCLGDARLAADRIRSVVRHAQGLDAAASELPPTTEDKGRDRPDHPSAQIRFRILIVDDEVALGHALARSLRRYDVTVLQSASVALGRLAAGERFDVILCDLAMPEMSGMDLYEEAVRLAPEQAQSFVFVTGGATTPRSREFVSSVPNVVLEKPFDVNKVRELIREKESARRQSARVVMVVDDDASSRKLVVRWLTESKYQCVEHESGTAALQELLDGPERFGAVVLDVMLPGVDGFEVVTKLKANLATAHIPIILLSAHAVGDADIARGMAAGATFYLTKPCRGPVLVAEVTAACERAAAEQALRTRLHLAEENATRDPLTGLMNRRAFEGRLIEAIANTTRHHEPLAVVMLDLDYFKQVNDTFGHAGGDRMLLYVARVLHRIVRLGDQTFRYGGEEFVLLLPKCDAAGAMQVVTRIRSHLRDKPVALVEGQPLVVRFSAGIATAEAKNTFRVDDIVARADEALYAAKKAGRDRIELER